MKWIPNPVSIEMYEMKDVLKEMGKEKDTSVAWRYKRWIFWCSVLMYNIIQDKFLDCILEDNIGKIREDYLKIEQSEREFIEKNFGVISK